MDLLNRTDFAILEVLDTSGRNVAPNIAEEIGANRSYVNTRFQTLTTYDLVQKVGPRDNSGLYEITEKGELAREYEEEFLNDELGEDLETLLEREMDDF
jgi:predicted ArsR family transcriptional regulator